jgi:signal transduction histidine kinase
VLKRLAPDLPPMLLDARGIEHVTGTLLRFALDSIAVGGRVRIETRRLPQHVLFELGHDGAHVPGEAIDQLFLPFAGASVGGGLSIAHRIIEQHGGELRVRADGEWTTVVTFTLPIVGNQDRRRTSRRRPRDRRERLAAS